MSYQSYERAARLEILSENAQKKERYTYFKQLSEDELNEEKEKYFKHKAELDAIEAEFEKAKAKYKEEKAMPESIVSQSYQVIKNKGLNVTEMVYLIPDYSNGTMDYVNEGGESVFNRRMFANERQIMMRASNG